MSTRQWWNPFSWRTTEESQDTRNPIKEAPRRPQIRDWTDSFTVNDALTRGLYHNSFPGLKLAGSLAFVPIAVPVYLMGLPIPVGSSDDLAEIVTDHATECGLLHMMSHRDATCWVWPSYSAKLGRDVWEFIPDETICDIIRDIETNEVVAIVTDEKINISVGYNVTGSARRIRTFTAGLVKQEWTELTMMQGYELKAGTFVNPSGVLPIAFANNRDGDEIRGHSDFERILTDLKNYHDIDLALSELLVKFAPKMVQEVDDADSWKQANGITSVAEIDVSKIDLIVNRYGKEKTTFVFPERAHEAFVEKLKLTFWKIVQGSGIPEMLWGNRVTGNVSTSDNQLDSVVKFVEDKQQQKNEPYRKLIEATARLRGIARMSGTAPIVDEIQWNALDMVSAETKAKIFQAFATGVASLVNGAGVTKQQLYRMWQRFYPSATDEEYEQFVIGLGETARHKSFANAPYENIIGLNSWDDTE